MDRKLCVVCSKVFRADLTICPDDGTVLVIEAGGERGNRLGHVIGNYRLLRVLGEGGVGTVYEAEHIRLGRKMALKLLHADVVTHELVTRFFNEARAVNEIRHPNIIDVEDFVTTPTGEHYMLMELLVGEDVRTAISRESVLDPERVAAIGEQVASALAAVHRVGIIHRDLKPDNIYLVMRDGKEVAKLLDFGIAKFTEEGTGLTRAGMTMGTPQYMAPEQIISGKEVGLSSDIYALGMVLYECLTGVCAFNSPTVANILRAHCFEAVVPPSVRLGLPLPPVLEAAVMKCLEKKPEQRFGSAAALCEALQSQTPVTLSQPVARPEERRAEPKRASRRRSIQMLPAFAMAAAALVLHLWPHGEAEHAAAAAATTPTAALAPAPAPVPMPAPTPAPAPVEPPAPTEIELALASQPPGAAMFLGTDRTPLGTAPLTASIPISSEPVPLIARFDDGREVVEMIVPDRPRPELVFVAPPAPVAVRKPVVKRPGTKPATKPVTKAATPDDRDQTLDPFKP